MNPDFVENNLKLFSERFPALAEMLGSVPFERVGTAQSEDGGICHAFENDDGMWRPVTNPSNPIQDAQAGIKRMEQRLVRGMSPAVVVGLYPGYVLDTVFRHFKQSTEKTIAPFRRIYVVIDSLICLAGWLKTSDRSEILEREEVEFFWHENIETICQLCEQDEQRSHLFVPLSSLPEDKLNAAIAPLAEFYLRREEETKQWQAESNAYYDAMTDDVLAEAIQGKVGRRPRLLMPTHTASTVVQYSTRDTCKAFEREGWETYTLKMERDLSPWRMAKAINEFKPDVLLFINHLRTEDDNIDLYPKNLMFITWVQDTMPTINRRDSAQKWNSNAQCGKRDLIVGYVGQLRQYGYLEDRLQEMPMIVDTEVFRPRDLTPEQLERYGCDVMFASNRSKPTDRILEEDLFPRLAPLGFSQDCLKEIHDKIWIYYREEKTITSREALRDFLFVEIPSLKEIYSKLDKDDQSNLLDRLFWQLNDPIYRFIILEWIDEYAQTHPGFKFYLYGKGWDRHSHYAAKYYRGSLQHGKELCTAYQAARLCLHLNSAEGGHQRLFEVLASGANPLWRKHSKNMHPSALPSAMRKLACCSMIHGASGGFTRQECECLNDLVIQGMFERNNIATGADALSFLLDRLQHDTDWLLASCSVFEERTSIYSVLAAEQNDDTEAMDVLFWEVGRRNCATLVSGLLNLLSSGVDHSATEILPDLPSIVAFVKQIRANAPLEILQDAFARIRYPGIRASMLLWKQQISMGAKECLPDLDEVEIRALAPEEQVELAGIIAHQKGIMRGIEIIEGLYAEDLVHTDGYAKLGWELYWQTHDYPNLIPLMRKDYDGGKISAAYAMNLARVYANNNQPDMAVRVVRETYLQDSHVKDGFAGVAWHYHRRVGAHAEALELILADKIAGRLSLEQHRNLAVELVLNQQNRRAIDTIEELYHKKPESTDCYADIARQVFGNRWGYERALEFYDRDMNSGRLSLSGRLWRAATIAVLGDLSTALSEVDDIYRSSRLIRGAYTILGWHAFACAQHAPNKVLDMIAMDKSLDRMDVYSHVYQARLLAMVGKYDQAMERSKFVHHSLQDMESIYALVNFIVFTRSPQEALRNFSMVEEEYRIGRIKPNHLGYFACLCAFCDRKELASEALAKARVETGVNNPGLWQAVFFEHLIRGDALRCLDMLETDRSSNLLNTYGLTTYAYFLWLASEHEKSLQIMSDVLKWADRCWSKYWEANNQLFSLSLDVEGFRQFVDQNRSQSMEVS